MPTGWTVEILGRAEPAPRERSTRVSPGWPGGSTCRSRPSPRGSSGTSSAGRAGPTRRAAALGGARRGGGGPARRRADRRKGPGKSETHPTEEALRRVNREYRVAEKVFRRYAGHTLRVLRPWASIASMRSGPHKYPLRVREHSGGPRIALALARAICRGTSASTSGRTRRVCHIIGTPGVTASWSIRSMQLRDRGLPAAQELDGPGEMKGPPRCDPERPIASSTNGSTSATSAARRCGCPASA